MRFDRKREHSNLPNRAFPSFRSTRRADPQWAETRNCERHEAARATAARGRYGAECSEERVALRGAWRERGWHAKARRETWWRGRGCVGCWKRLWRSEGCGGECLGRGGGLVTGPSWVWRGVVKWGLKKVLFWGE